MGKNKKKPRVAIEPSPTKQPKTGPRLDSDQAKPSWRLSRLECSDDFGAWHKLTQEKIHEIRQKLSNFESMTWYEILVKSKKQNHHVPVDRLVSRARQRLGELKLDDLDELVSLHLSGKERVYGILEGGALLLLWWDPSHAIYEVEKKHT